MTKRFYILLLVLLGFFLMPTVSYACKTKSVKTEKSCCDKKMSSKKDCCKTSLENDDEGCKGKCGSDSCHCSSPNLAIVQSFIAEIKHYQVFFEKEDSIYKESCVSSDCFSVWSPPKIS